MLGEQLYNSNSVKIGRFQLCFDVKERGDKMIDHNQDVLSFSLNFIFKLLDNSYQSSWKTLENRCIDENFLFCILRSNVKLKSWYLVGRLERKNFFFKSKNLVY